MAKHIILLLLIAGFFHSAGAQESSAAREGKFVMASCQFPVSQSIAENYNWIEAQMMESKLKKADIVHFSECALSGYPGVDFETMEGFKWDELAEKTDSIISLARQLKIWVILGSIHPLDDDNKPTNCLYLINPEGEIIDRYDKRFCTNGDLKHFTAGEHFVNFELKGVNCGLLICYDVRFPELYREYKKRETDMIFQSFHNARQSKGKIHPVIMPITSQTRAATNYFYMSLTNSSAPESWPCHFITPDGLIQNKLPKNVDGVLISTVDLSLEYYDASWRHRDDAMKGILNSSEPKQ